MKTFPFRSPLTLSRHKNFDDKLCHAEISSNVGGNWTFSQCPCKHKFTRTFNDGAEHPCCGKHMVLHDKEFEKHNQAEARRTVENALEARCIELRKEGIDCTPVFRSSHIVHVDVALLEQLVKKAKG